MEKNRNDSDPEHNFFVKIQNFVPDLCILKGIYISWLFTVVGSGVNLALLSRVMSSRLSRGTYNGGLLSTEAGTIARVIADGTITLAGYLGQSRLLNVTLLPSLFICISSIVATCFTYNSLYWLVINSLYQLLSIQRNSSLFQISPFPHYFALLSTILAAYCKKTSSFIFSTVGL